MAAMLQASSGNATMPKLDKHKKIEKKKHKKDKKHKKHRKDEHKKHKKHKKSSRRYDHSDSSHLSEGEEEAKHGTKKMPELSSERKESDPKVEVADELSSTKAREHD